MLFKLFYSLKLLISTKYLFIVFFIRCHLCYDVILCCLTIGLLLTQSPLPRRKSRLARFGDAFVSLFACGSRPRSSRDEPEDPFSYLSRKKGVSDCLLFHFYLLEKKNPNLKGNKGICYACVSEAHEFGGGMVRENVF